MAFELIIPPPVVAHSLNPIAVVLRCSNPYDPYIRCVCTILENTGTDDVPVWTAIVSTEEYVRTGTDKYIFQLQNYIHNRLNQFDLFDPETAIPFLITKNARSYMFHFDEYVGETQDVTSLEDNLGPTYVIKGGSDNLTFVTLPGIIENYIVPTEKMLTWFKTGQIISATQPYLFLTWYNYTGLPLTGIQLYGDIRSIDGAGVITTTPYQIDYAGITVNPGRLLCIPTSPLKMDIASIIPPGDKIIDYTVGVSNLSHTATCTPHRYVIDPRYFPNERYFLYLSTVGAWEILRTTGKGNRKADITGSIAEKDYTLHVGEVSAWLDPQQTVFENDISSRNSVKVSSGPKTRHEVALFEDFRLAPIKFEVTPQYGLRQIFIDEKSIDLGPDQDPTPSFAFTYKYAEAAKGFAPSFILD